MERSICIHRGSGDKGGSICVKEQSGTTLSSDEITSVFIMRYLLRRAQMKALDLHLLKVLILQIGGSK